MVDTLSLFIEQTLCDAKLPGLAAKIINAQGDKLYENVFGVNDLDGEPTNFTTSTPGMLWSCTKIISSIAGLQLLEEGKLSLDDPVSKYLPEITELGVLDGTTDAEGILQSRLPKSEVLVRHLFTHSSGFAHDYFNPKMLKWRIQNKSPIASNFSATTRSIYHVPLVSNPGTAYHYGPSSEWLGFLIEAVSGVPLHDYITEHILKPLKMNSTTATFDPSAPRLVVHARGETGRGPLQSAPTVQPLLKTEVRSAGAYLISTVDDFTQILLTLLNGGFHPPTATRLLKQETVDKYLFQDQLPEGCDRSEIGEINPTLPHLSRKGSLLDGVPRGWSCGMMLNLEDVQGGRRKNSGMWAGLGNNYYWVDPVGNRAGLVFTAVLPWIDPDVLNIFEAVERVAYGGQTHEPCRKKLHAVS